MTCVAKDEAGNSNQCSFELTVLVLRGAKLRILSEILGYRELPARHLRLLDQAIARLRRATEEERWIDGKPLRSERGSRVFWDEAMFARGLQRLLRSKSAPVLSPFAYNWLEDLGQMDKTLARLKINEATEREANPSLLARAEREFAARDRVRSKQKYQQSILHYLKAWRMAVRFVHHLETHE